ncbi:MAG: imidazoleglycerol-phosphate dehydratase [Candidatus Thorarchaeota archaeon]
MRSSKVNRTTRETAVKIEISLDGNGEASLDFSPEFMRHMLTALVVHSEFDVTLDAQGDLQHHLIEDIALCFGKAIRESIDDVNVIGRFGDAIIPMDCSLALVAVDICNRPYSVIDLCSKESRVEDTLVQDIEHFLNSLAASLAASIHVKVLYGENDHHKIEAAFKALGIALKQATRFRDEAVVLSSSKGVL